MAVRGKIGARHIARKEKLYLLALQRSVLITIISGVDVGHIAKNHHQSSSRMLIFSGSVLIRIPSGVDVRHWYRRYGCWPDRVGNEDGVLAHGGCLSLPPRVHQLLARALHLAAAH